ncbi:MAG: HD domain-containing protein [Patescibacteria group bacterium]
MENKIPLEVLDIAKKLTMSKYSAYLVGGCVRDLILGLNPKDWDIATNAKPLDIQKLFPNSLYENSFGTVAVKTNSNDPALKLVEVTTFRLEGKYTDKRHPDEIKFAKTIEEDLSRRDFTVNALALNLPPKNLKSLSSLIDPYKGAEDISAKLICCVGSPEERFNEDALRLIRAIRFAVELDFSIEENTKKAINKNAKLLSFIAKERVRDEFIKIIMSQNAAKGIQLLEDTGLMKCIIPELREGINCAQNKHHIYTVWEHNLRSLDYTVSKNYSFEIRLAALLHDVGKPKTKRGEGESATFYGHEVVGARMVAEILKELKFSNEVVEKVVHLVRCHLFYYNVGDVTPAGVRRFIKRVGAENISDLIKVREADRIGSGVPKAVPYKLRHLLYMIEKVREDPISSKMLAIDGKDIMDIAKLNPSPKVGQILDILLDEVLEDPKRNEVGYLKEKAEELASLSESDLSALQSKAKGRKEEFEEGIEEEMKERYYVK